MKEALNVNYLTEKRFKKTASFLEKHIPEGEKIIDLGPKNALAEFLKERGHHITNTSLDTDLDLNWDILKKEEYTVLTAFEILEHLVSPFPLLRESKSKYLVASIPLKLWFASAYWSETDPLDRHYHEFEPKQFDMLLEKAGWEIKASEKWTIPTRAIGFRPILRRFTPRYYIVYCERV